MSFLEISGLGKTFSHKPDLISRTLKNFGRASSIKPSVQAVRDVSVSVEKGEVIGLIGESGCGKSTVARMLAGITRPTKGTVLLDGHDIIARKTPEARAAALDVQMIFQDAAAAMNPRFTIQDIIAEAPLYHGRIKAKEARDKVAEVLEAVSMSPDIARQYPHQFSGGQRQRIGIARALAMNPRLLICDESVAALDVSIQAQVINLFMKLRKEFGLTYVFISHDLSVVRHLSDRVAIMYLGEVVENAPTEALFADPKHPYTRALMAQNPSIRNRRKEHIPLSGEVPSPINPPSGCYFNPRCQQAMTQCIERHPALVSMGANRSAACFLHSDQEKSL
ncbi:ATP-binding cassette domain-containing protein [Nitratireductor aquimarinus]|uniref:ABC transporter ATP-binding protein n=1 Tax=Nitratireductor aquimarinus TaxID=889300 RepID=UPI001CD575CA|nr:ABC transporter ATP-binding protein [Nitratireductor aquimarinus]MCA1305238.1 ATP-binding cassette domain-containing protein [Nitratireductor aquimarinus]